MMNPLTKFVELYYNALLAFILAKSALQFWEC